MKQYFRQQDAFRQRPLTTSSPYQQVEYDTTTTQKIKQRPHLYSPAVAVTSSDVGYQVEQQSPLNHRPSYNQNEVNVEYEPNPYHVPSELPALTPDIPGLVNNLQEKDKLPLTTTPLSEPEPETRPTRRPVLRTRKPAVTKVVTTSSVSYSESESSKPAHRIRRPYNNRVNTENTDETVTTVTTRRPPASSRNPLLRNPNRIRYQPSTEERQSLKVKKKPFKGGKHGQQGEDQDLDYQRDVLKQNYPVFKSRRPTSPTAIPSSYDVGNTEGPASESQQVYTVTPSNSIDQPEQNVYPASLLEPMQIAQHYNEFSKDNYGPGYFPNQEDLTPTEAIIRNEVNTIFTTTPPPTTQTTTTTTTVSTTTEAPTTAATATTTRRSPFIRRNYPRVRTTTTTETPVTTTTPAEERPSLRARLPPRRVVKVRQRQRRPLHPASSTAAPEPEAELSTQRQNLRKLSRYNQQQQQQDKQEEQQQTPSPPRRRYKQPFQLEGQESQWSPASENSNSGSNTNSFKPLNPKYGKSETHSYENEPDIVTAGPTGQPETFEFNVAADLSGSAGQRTTPAIKEPNLKPEKSFAELLEEVMGKAPEQLATESPTSSTLSRLNRRGKWKKARVPSGTEHSENFETAESQNLAPQLYNSLYSNNEKAEDSTKSTTPQATETESPTTAMPEVTTAVTPTTPEEYEASTPKTADLTTISSTLPMSEESATRRMDTAADVDDLDTQPSIFSEVKQQLHDLFAIDESEDEAVTAALAAVGKRRQEYTSIKRLKPAAPIESTTDAEVTEANTTVGTPASNKEDSFHKDLMQNVVYATSTSTKVTSETEICYRGRCIRSEDLPANHKLH